MEKKNFYYNLNEIKEELRYYLNILKQSPASMAKPLSVVS